MTLANSLTAELDKLATACRILAMEGHNDVSLGHLSLRDPDGRGLWLKRFYLGLDEVMGAEDFILIDFDGKQLDGAGERHAEWPIHAEILRARTDVNIVAHGHPFYASLLAATGQPLLPVGQEGIYVAGNTPYYKDTSDLINTTQLGRDLAKALGDASMVFMKNHGITYCAKTIAEATILGINIEKASKAQLTLSASGMPWSHPDLAETEGKTETMANLGLWDNFFAYYTRKLARFEGRHGEAERMRAETLVWKRNK